jgi:cell division protein ZapA
MLGYSVVTPPSRALTMRINCPHCGQKAVITSRDEQSTTVANLYCSCTNTKACSHSFVFTLSFSHSINPPVTTTLEMAASLIRSLGANERQQLLNI